MISPANVPIRGLPLKDGIYRTLAFQRYPELLNAISTRRSPEGGDWNMSARRGSPQHPPSPETALANRSLFASYLGIPPERMVACRQVHGTEVAVVGSDDAGRGVLAGSPPIPDTDAMVTATRNLFMMVLAADCPPVFLYDPVQHVAGLAHSGWKGTVGRIAGRVVETMQGEFGTRPEDVQAVVGPGIGPCCYKVGPSVVEAAEASFAQPWRATRYGPPLFVIDNGEVYFNLWEAIRRTLIESGVGKLNINIEGMCTMHNTSLFYSHRGEAGQCGLFSAVLGVRET